MENLIKRGMRKIQTLFNVLYYLNMKQKIGIVGGGLAGLSSAYYILKGQAEPPDITIFESGEHIGGRVNTVMVDNVPIDLGGFMIFPFYSCLYDFIDELGLKKFVHKIKTSREFYQLKPGEDFVRDRDLSLSQLVPFSLLRHFVGPLLEGKISYYEPDFDLFDGISTHDFYKSVLKDRNKENEELFNELSLAYTYPSLAHIPMSVYMVTCSTLFLNGMFNFCSYLDGGTGLITAKAGDEIKKKGGRILTNKTVVRVSPRQVELADGTIEEFDKIVVAAAPSKTIFPDYFKNNEQIDHTHFFTAIVKLKEPALINGEPWFVAYCSTDKKNPVPQITSIGQCSTYSDLSSNYLTVNVQVDPTTKEKKISDDDIYRVISTGIKQVFKDENHVDEIPAFINWPQTMPILGVPLLKEIRQRQGENGIYFAGDYTGLPCMDTAIYSGKKIATEIFKN